MYQSQNSNPGLTPKSVMGPLSVVYKVGSMNPGGGQIRQAIGAQ